MEDFVSSYWVVKVLKKHFVFLTRNNNKQKQKTIVVKVISMKWAVYL